MTLPIAQPADVEPTNIMTTSTPMMTDGIIGIKVLSALIHSLPDYLDPTDYAHILSTCQEIHIWNIYTSHRRRGITHLIHKNPKRVLNLLDKAIEYKLDDIFASYINAVLEYLQHTHTGTGTADTATRPKSHLFHYVNWNPRFNSWLVGCADFGLYKSVKTMLNGLHTPNLGIQFETSSAVSIAASHGYLDIVTFLLEWGSPLFLTSAEWDLVLEGAKMDLNVLKRFVECDVGFLRIGEEKVYHVGDHDGWILLKAAEVGACKEVVEYLLAVGEGEYWRLQGPLVGERVRYMLMVAEKRGFVEFLRVWENGVGL
ncbi:hypothetical protein HDU76_005477 [Blyttiomyces sp. JEL0837]|nr:hypothetical protein HDU76_005477 [Blyttiomyces sp. JEL0837]